MPVCCKLPARQPGVRVLLSRAVALYGGSHSTAADCNVCTKICSNEQEVGMHIGNRSRGEEGGQERERERDRVSPFTGVVLIA